MAEARLRVRLDGAKSAAVGLQRLQGTMGGVATMSGRMRTGFDRMKTGLFSMRGALAGAGVYGFGRFVGSALEASNAMRSAENGFLRLAQTRGIPNARKQLRLFNDQLDGMSSRANTASLASRLMATNSNLNADAVAKVLRFSRDWADTTGQKLMPVLDSLSSALGGMELETIRRLGLEVDFKTALIDKAKALGKSASALTEEEKRAAKTAVVLEAIARKHKEIGRTAITAANNITKFSANWENVKAGIGEGFGEYTGPALGFLADIMGGGKVIDKATGERSIGAAVSTAAREYGLLGAEIAEGLTGTSFGSADRLEAEIAKEEMTGWFSSRPIKTKSVQVTQKGGN